MAVSSKALEESLPQWGNYLALVMEANRDGRLDLVLLRQMGSDQPEPIPQTKTVAISILLRAPDAPPVSDPNYQGLWWNPDESGWGINFAHQGDIIFATWFTYDVAGKPWWLIAELHKTAAGICSGNVSTGRGSNVRRLTSRTRARRDVA